MTLSTDVRYFFDYLRTFKRKFLGIKMLTLPGFISIYLNYDTDYNPVRRAIFDCSEKSKKQMTIDCLDYIKLKPGKVYGCYQILGNYSVSKELVAALMEVDINAFTNIHNLMYSFLQCNNEEIHQSIVCFFESCFDVDFEEVMKTAQGYLDQLKLDDDVYALSPQLAKIAHVIDGKREDYRLFVGEDYKDNIWGDMLKYEANNVILVADYTNSIQAYVYNMAYEISHDVSCPTRRNIVLLEVDLQDVIKNAVTDDDYVKAIQEVVNVLLAEENKENVVVYLKNFNVLLKNRGNGFGYIFYVYPLLQDDDLRVIINMDEPELQAVGPNNRFMELVEVLCIETPNKEEFLPYMEGPLLQLSLHHGVYADGKNAEVALQYVKAMDYGGNVNGTKSLLDYVMAFVNNQGRSQIEESDYMEYFKLNFHDQEKQTDKYKKLVAYHEAGHFVVSRFCKYYKAVYSDLISVVSVSDYGGVNVLEEDASLIGSNDYNFYLDSLAMELAGRASEELFLDEISAGAVSDLEQATNLATAMVSKLGLDKSKKIKGNENLNSEKAMNEVSSKVNEILEEAYDLATELLSEHAEYVHSLAKKLLEKKIISRKEILSMEVKEGDVVYLK